MEEHMLAGHRKFSSSRRLCVVGPSLISLVVAWVATGCATPPPVQGPESGASPLPAELAVHLRLVEPTAEQTGWVDRATGEPGHGGVTEGLPTELVESAPVYRMWNGPESGTNNRIGGWWTLTPPSGDVATYRADYAICTEWNELRWVAQCELAAGTFVVVGPTQSAQCNDPTESYPPSADAWQVYVPNAATNPGLRCPDPAADREANPNDLAAP
ncbi:MAG: hypothetical protein KC668_08790 [Myxococcales bacterium]|nr:hypothetical protein [Myxococcales bacterium]